jgi:hypothetical protein
MRRIRKDMDRKYSIFAQNDNIRVGLQDGKKFKKKEDLGCYLASPPFF